MVLRVREATVHPHHEFIADNVSICDEKRFAPIAVLGPKTITDVYLLALAVANDATFATFDRRVSIAAVVGAKPGHLIVL
jgi:uncharacterized protein